MKNKNNTYFLVNCINANDNIKEDVSKIMFMPIGVNDICASSNDKPVELSVEVNKQAFENVKASFEALLKNGKEPYIDFDHKRENASGFVKDVLFDKDKGIFISVQWSSRGKEAVSGKEYKFFSPSFNFDKKSGVVGVNINMGGLVNEPAFTKIEKISAKENKNLTNKNNMEKLKDALLKAGLIKDVSLEEDALVGELENALLAKKQKHSQLLGAKEEEVKNVQKQKEAVEAKLATIEKANASSLVEVACKDGRILASDEETKSFWVNCILAQGENAINALNALKPNNVLGRIVNAKKDEQKLKDEDMARQINARAQEICSKEDISFSLAWARAENEITSN